MKLSEEEQKRIKLHHKVAPPIPRLKHVKSLRGQLAFDFEGKGEAGKSSGGGSSPTTRAGIAYMKGLAALTPAQLENN